MEETRSPDSQNSPDSPDSSDSSRLLECPDLPFSLDLPQTYDVFDFFETCEGVDLSEALKAEYVPRIETLKEQLLKKAFDAFCVYESLVNKYRQGYSGPELERKIKTARERCVNILLESSDAGVRIDQTLDCLFSLSKAVIEEEFNRSK